MSIAVITGSAGLVESESARYFASADGRTGLHSTPGDAEDLARKVEWAWSRPAGLRKQVHGGKKLLRPDGHLLPGARSQVHAKVPEAEPAVAE